MATAMEEWGDDSTDAGYSVTDDIQLPLEEFVNTQTLPQSVSVARGMFMSQDVMIARGDVLILQGMAPDSVTLSFSEAHSEQKHELAVSPDIPLTFLVLPPKDSVQSDPQNQGEGKGRPVSIVTYPTVADLMMDCPTYFEANSTFDDPYLPGFSVKPGDRFRYVKVVTGVAGDRMERLQCRTESGELVCLSTRCKGNFTVLKDDTPYTLRQLIDQARVPRRLKVAPENDMENSESKDIFVDQESKVPDALKSCTGVITMSRPAEMLEASPWDNPEISLSVPLDANLHVRAFSMTDYEEPVTSRRVKPESLAAFVSEHEHKFPVQATVFTYTSPPAEVSKYLHSSREIIVHELSRSHKVFVKDSKEDKYFVVDQSVDISFVQLPRMLSSVFEMMALPLGSEVQVLADIAADFPEPFCLRYGDVLRVTKHESFSWKFKHSSTGDVPIVKCERVVQAGKPEKLKLPLDLEVCLVLCEDPSKLEVTKLSDILSGVKDIPTGEVSVIEGNGASYPPLPAIIQILKVLPESELIISPLSATAAISPLIKTCLKIPLRHEAQFVLKRKLEFPDGYFVMPSSRHYLSLGIESIMEGEYEQLVQAQKVATDYEDIAFGCSRSTTTEEDSRSLGSSSGRSRHAVNSETSSIPKSASSGTLEQKRRKDRVKRISRALNPKNWRLAGGGTSATAPDKEESATPPTPVSGILTLSLQPPQALDNDYMEISDETSGNSELSFHPPDQGAEGEGFEDDPYEAINITPAPQSADTSLSVSTDRKFSALSMPEGLCSNAPQLPQRPEKSDYEGISEDSHLTHRRRKTEPSIILSEETERTRRALSPDSGREGRKRHQEHSKGLEPSQDLERVPPVRHTRSRSSDWSDRHKRNRNAHSPDRGRQHSHDQHTDRTPTAPERHRKYRVKNSGPVKHTQKHKVQSPEQEAGKLDKLESEGNASPQVSNNRQKKNQNSDSSVDNSRAHIRKTRPPEVQHSGGLRTPEKQRRARSPDCSSKIPGTRERGRKTKSPESPPLGDPRPPERQQRVRSPDIFSKMPGTPDMSAIQERQGGEESAPYIAMYQQPRDKHGRAESPDHLLDHSKISEKQKQDESSEYVTAYPPTPENKRKAKSADDSSKPETGEREREVESSTYMTAYPQRSDRQQKSTSPDHHPKGNSHEQEKSRKIPPDPPSRNIQKQDRNQPGTSDPSVKSSVPERQLKTDPHHRSEDVEQDRGERAKKSPASNPHSDQSPKKLQSPAGDQDAHIKRPQRPRRKLDASSEKTANRSMDSIDDDVGENSDNKHLSTVHSNSPRTAEKVSSKKDGGVREKPAIPPKPVIASARGAPAKKLEERQKPVAPPRKRAVRIGSTEAEMFSEGSSPKPVLGRKQMK